MSAMIMNYPPPTIVSMFATSERESDREQEKLKGVLAYLEDQKVVKDNDLVMLVDGRDTWFQLPSEVMIRQYMHTVADANRRVQKTYGQAFTQTVMFGAKKTCEGDEAACKYMPSSILPRDIYRTGVGMLDKTELLPAKYLNADMVMGPVKDLRVLFQAAAKLFGEKEGQSATMQSVMSTLFGEQMLARQTHKKSTRPLALKMYHHIAGLASSKDHEDIAAATLRRDRQYEFSIGLDYTHALFQPLSDCAENELLMISPKSSQRRLTQNDNSSADLPPAFINANGPFWRPDDRNNDPSPNDKPAYIDKLEYKYGLDKLPRGDTPWNNVSLIQNTYTGTIPATFQVTYRRRNTGSEPEEDKRNSIILSGHSHIPNVTWNSLWYSGHERALLRRYFRTPQSPMGYHTAAVGGDLLWDQRGGRGGVWTAESGLWLPWGEVDGVCGTYELMKDVFGDKKGVWFHEDEEGGGKKGREEAEENHKKHIEEERKKDEEWMADMEKERVEKEAEEKAKQERERLEREEQQRKQQEEQQKKQQEKEAKEREEADLKAAEAAVANMAAVQAIGESPVAADGVDPGLNAGQQAQQMQKRSQRRRVA